MLKERVEGLLPQEEAFVIVKSMQSAEESTEVASVLQRKLEQRVVRINKELRTDEQRVTRPNALEFEEFIEVILGVHLRHHEAKIAEVRRAGAPGPGYSAGCGVRADLASASPADRDVL